MSYEVPLRKRDAKLRFCDCGRMIGVVGKVRRHTCGRVACKFHQDHLVVLADRREARKYGNCLAVEIIDNPMTEGAGR